MREPLTHDFMDLYISYSKRSLINIYTTIKNIFT